MYVSFTIYFCNRAGPALVGDPDLGFSGLQMFGPALVHQTKLKIRKDIATTNFMLVDTPGMIGLCGCTFVK